MKRNLWVFKVLNQCGLIAGERFLWYDYIMPWDYTKIAYREQAAQDAPWRLERLINYGLGGEQLKREELEKYLPQLAIPADRRAFLELLVWNKPF